MVWIIIYYFINTIFSDQQGTTNLVFTSMERNLRRCKTNIFPASPLNGASVVEAFQKENVNKFFGLSRHDVPTQFYKGTQITASFENTFYASDTIIEIIKTNIPTGKRNYLMDATFKIVPFGTFKQFLIIYVEYIEKVYPFEMLLNRFTQTLH
jgi:hypothetical protein